MKQAKYIKERNMMIQRVMMSMRRKKINVECLPTEDAISAYNYLGELKIQNKINGI